MTDTTSAYLSRADLVEFLGKHSTEQTAEIARLQVAKTAALKVADERTKENCELRQLLRDARDHVPWDVLKRIDAALGASRAEQEGNGK